MNSVQQTLIGQLKAFGARGPFVLWGENSVKFHVRYAGAIVEYKPATDLYDVTYYSGTSVSHTVEGVYADSLDAVVAQVRKAGRTATI